MKSFTVAALSFTFAAATAHAEWNKGLEAYKQKDWATAVKEFEDSDGNDVVLKSNILHMALKVTFAGPPIISAPSISPTTGTAFGGGLGCGVAASGILVAVALGMLAGVGIALAAYTEFHPLEGVAAMMVA